MADLAIKIRARDLRHAIFDANAHLSVPYLDSFLDRELIAALEAGDGDRAALIKAAESAEKRTGGDMPLASYHFLGAALRDFAATLPEPPVPGPV